MTIDNDSQTVWPPSPTEGTSPVYDYRGGGIQTYVEGGVLVLRFVWQHKVGLLCSCIMFSVFLVVYAVLLVDIVLTVPPSLVNRTIHFVFKAVFAHMFHEMIVNSAFVLVFWLLYDLFLKRGLYKFSHDGSVVTGGVRPKRWEGVQYVKLRLRRGFLQFGSYLYLGFDTAQHKPNRWPRLLGSKALPNEITLSFTLNQAAAQRVTKIVAAFLRVPAITEA